MKGDEGDVAGNGWRDCEDEHGRQIAPPRLGIARERRAGHDVGNPAGQVGVAQTLTQMLVPGEIERDDIESVKVVAGPEIDRQNSQRKDQQGAQQERINSPEKMVPGFAGIVRD